MNLMRTSELRRYAKETHGQAHDTDAEAFLDAYQYGAYHESRADWHGLAAKLSREDAAKMWPGVCHWLIAGSVENREGEPLKILMDLHDLIVAWQSTTLDSTARLYQLLDNAAEMLTAELNTSPYWRQVALWFVILNSAIRQSAGIHPMRFSSAVKKLESALD